MLPVFVSDGCGYPNLSTVLRALKDAKSARWRIFKHYLAIAARGGELRPCERHATEASLDKLQQLALSGDGAIGKKLDKRYDIEDNSRGWVLVFHHDSAEMDSMNVHQ